MSNTFLDLIKSGKIKDLEGLKKAFRNMAKKNHPDTAGTDRYVKQFIRYMEEFKEARIFLDAGVGGNAGEEPVIRTERRLSFYNELMQIYHLEGSLLMTRRKETADRIGIEIIKAESAFMEWNPDYEGSCRDAFEDYEKIKNEKHKNDLTTLRNRPIYMNLRPVLFNIASFHITGLDVHKKQVGRSLALIMQRLEESGYVEFKKFLIFLIDDMNYGPAVFE